MSRSTVHVIRRVVLLALCILCCASSTLGAQTRKEYSPFDEARPKVPETILADNRLDQRVKVFAKSRNMRQVLADLSAKTGVRITAARDVADERPIIFFHNRPLRDVMTEISGLYGYRWLVSGKQGSYEYEMFEDTRREEKRTRITAAIKAEQDETLLDFVKQLAAGGKEAGQVLEQLKLTNPEAYEHMTLPEIMGATKVLQMLDFNMLSQVLAGNSAGCKVGDLPPSVQAAIRDRVKMTLPDMSDSEVPEMMLTAKRVVFAADGMPYFDLGLAHPQRGSSMNLTWPTPSVTGDDMRRATGRHTAESVLGDKLDLGEPKITAEKLRWLPHAKGLLLGDVLEAVAIQSGRDVIADYYLQDRFLEAIKEQPIGKVVQTVCDKFNYSCQVSNRTLRFRNNKWYAEDPLREPPAHVVGNLWSRLEQTGQLGIHDLAEMASLNDPERNWPGFRFIPGVDDAQKQPAVVRFWTSLSASDETTARSDDGLAVNDLVQVQQDRLNDWTASRGIEVSPEDLEMAVLLITTPHPDVKDSNGGAAVYWSERDSERGATSLGMGFGESLKPFTVWSQSTFESVCLRLPGKKPVSSTIRLYHPLGEQERKEIATQRKADAEAEIVQLIQ